MNEDNVLTDEDNVVEVYSYDIAMMIVDIFEDLLDKHNIDIPCESELEEDERKDLGKCAAHIYGSECSDLMDEIESIIIEHIATPVCTAIEDDSVDGIEFIEGEFSGTI